MKCRKVKVSICLLAPPVRLPCLTIRQLSPSFARRASPVPLCPLAGDDQLGRVLTALFVKTVPLVQGEVTKGTQGDN